VANPVNPVKTNELIVDLVKQYNTGWVYSAGLADYAIGKMREDFVTNGPTRPSATSTPRGCSG
jgi:hypothetical protein